MSETIREQLREIAISEVNEHWERVVHVPRQVRDLLAKAFEYGWGRDEFSSRVVLEFQRRMTDDGCVPLDSPGIERVSVLHDASTFDDGLSARLIKETLEDHERYESDGSAARRLRNNAPDLAKQLKAAIARAEGCRRALELQLDKLPEYAAEIERLVKERDDLRHDLELSLPERYPSRT